MRIIFPVAVLAGVLLAQPAVAERQYPWCVIQFDSDGGEISTCGYVSRQQCLDFIWGVGGYCRVNPYVAAAQGHPEARPAKKRRKPSS